MKKQILNIGNALNKAEQKQISGGFNPEDVPHIEIFPDGLTGGWIDTSPEDCNYPYVMHGGRCRHCYDIGQCR